MAKLFSLQKTRVLSHSEQRSHHGKFSVEPAKTKKPSGSQVGGTDVNKLMVKKVMVASQDDGVVAPDLTMR